LPRSGEWRCSKPSPTTEVPDNAGYRAVDDTLSMPHCARDARSRESGGPGVVLVVRGVVSSLLCQDGGRSVGARGRYRLAAAVPAPMEHRIEPAGVPPRVIMETRGLHAAPVSASEHRSCTGASTLDRLTILVFVYAQVPPGRRVPRRPFRAAMHMW
jgi:hypothetical protein